MSDEKYTVGKIGFSPYKTVKVSMSKEQISADLFAMRDPDGIAKKYVEVKSENDKLKATILKLCDKLDEAADRLDRANCTATHGEYRTLSQQVRAELTTK